MKISSNQEWCQVDELIAGPVNNILKTIYENHLSNLNINSKIGSLRINYKLFSIWLLYIIVKYS